MPDLPADNPFAKFKAGTSSDNPFAKFKATTPDAAPAQPPSAMEALWNTASGMVQAPSRFAQGVAEGATGEPVPDRASQVGGMSRFAGRAVGAGGASVLEGLWDMVKAPGKAAFGGMTLPGGGGVPEPGMPIPEGSPGIWPSWQGHRDSEMAQAGRGMAMALAGGGGFRPGMVRPGGSTLGMGAGGERPVGGGRVEPAAPGQPPIIPPGQQPPRPTTGAMPPPEPGIAAPPGGTSQPSALASAIAEGDPTKVDQAITRRYRQAIKPGQTGVKMSDKGIAQEDQRIMTVIDQIIGNRKDTTLTDARGAARPEGSVPYTRRQLLEGQGQVMEKMYQEFNDLNRASGALGVRVPLDRAVQHYREFANRAEILADYPEVAADALRRAERLEKIGGYTPEEAQRALKNFNGELQGFYQQKGEASVAKSGMIAPAADIIRETLNDVIEQSAGPGYAAFRQKFGAFRSVQRDLAAAARKDLAQQPDMFSKFADFLSSESFIRAIATMSPEKAATGIGWNLAKRVSQRLNDPNRAVEQLFKRRMKTLEPPPPPRDVAAPVFGATAPAMGYRLAQPQSGGFPQPKRDPDQPLRQTVF